MLVLSAFSVKGTGIEIQLFKSYIIDVQWMSRHTGQFVFSFIAIEKTGIRSNEYLEIIPKSQKSTSSSTKNSWWVQECTANRKQPRTYCIPHTPVSLKMFATWRPGQSIGFFCWVSPHLFRFPNWYQPAKLAHNFIMNFHCDAMTS